MSAVSSAEVDTQLSLLVRKLGRLEREAEGLAYGAVSGDMDAATRLAAINAEISRAYADRQVFERAKVAALELEAEAKRHADDARCAEHFDLARGHVGKLLALAGRVDAIVDEFGRLIN